jgi:hypothetical protein
LMSYFQEQNYIGDYQLPLSPGKLNG